MKCAKIVSNIEKQENSCNSKPRKLQHELKKRRDVRQVETATQGTDWARKKVWKERAGKSNGDASQLLTAVRSFRGR